MTRVLATLLGVSLGLGCVGSISPVLADEGGAFVPPGDTVLAMTIDLTGDDQREVLRVAAPGAGPRFLEAWAHEAAGWALVDRAGLDRAAGEDQRVRLGEGDPVGLLAWREGGTEHAILAIGGASRPGGGMDLELWLVSLSRGELVRVPLNGGGGSVQWLVAVDLDADGTDELVVTEPSTIEGTFARVLRWTGAGFDSERLSIGGSRARIVPTVGDTDGLPGDEVLFAISNEQVLVRIATTASRVSLERKSAGAGSSQTRTPWAAVAAGGRLALHAGSSLHLVEWPRGGNPVSVSATESTPFPTLAVVGRGDAAIVLDYPGLAQFGSETWEARIYDVELARIGAIPVGEAIARAQLAAMRQVAEAAHIGAGGRPYLGPIPGGLDDGREGYISAGNLVTIEDDQVMIKPVGSFAGARPVGVAGPGGAWLVLTSGYSGWRDRAYLATIPTPREHSLRIVPLTEALEPESDGGRLLPQLQTAVMVESPDGPAIAAADGGFEMQLSVPMGSAVTGVVDRHIQDETVAGAGGSATLHLDPRPRRNEPIPFNVAVVAIAPAGQLYSGEWFGLVLREPPTLSASSDTKPLAFEAIVEGTTDAYATVTVDGRRIDVDRHGAFRSSVGAPPWPRDVTVVATDPLGQESAARVRVVGFVDYLGLPWIPILGALTVVAGIAMYVRLPRRQPPEGTADLGVLEEVDLD